MSSDVEEVYVLIKACLTSSSHALSESSLIKDYSEFTGESTVPFRRYGFNSFHKFMETVPAVRKVTRNGEIYYEAIPSENTKHITDLVKGQRNAKKKSESQRKWSKSNGTKGYQKNTRNTAYVKNTKDNRNGRPYSGDQNIRKDNRTEQGRKEGKTRDSNTKRFNSGSHDESKRMYSDEIRRNSPQDEYMSNRQRNLPVTKERGYDSNEFNNKPRDKIHDNGRRERKPAEYLHGDIEHGTRRSSRDESKHTYPVEDRESTYTDKFKRDHDSPRDGYSSNRQNDISLHDGNERGYISKEFHNKAGYKIRDGGRYDRKPTEFVHERDQHSRNTKALNPDRRDESKYKESMEERKYANSDRYKDRYNSEDGYGGGINDEKYVSRNNHRYDDDNEIRFNTVHRDEFNDFDALENRKLTNDVYRSMYNSEDCSITRNDKENFVRGDRNRRYDSDDDLRFNPVHRGESKNVVPFEDRKYMIGDRNGGRYNSENYYDGITDESNYVKEDRNHHGGSYRHDDFNESRSVHRDRFKYVDPLEDRKFTNGDRYKGRYNQEDSHAGLVYKGNYDRGDGNHLTGSHRFDRINESAYSDEYEDNDQFKYPKPVSTSSCKMVYDTDDFDRGFNDGGNYQFPNRKHKFRSSPMNNEDFDGTERLIKLPHGEDNLSVTIPNNHYKGANNLLDIPDSNYYHGHSERTFYDDKIGESWSSKNYSYSKVRKAKREMSDRKRHETADAFRDFDRRQPRL